MQPETRASRVPESGVSGVQESHLDPQYWIRSQRDAERTLLDAPAIAAQNERLRRLDPSINDLELLAPALSGEQVRGWVEALAKRPANALFDVEGREVPAATLEALAGNVALDSIPTTAATRYGLAVHRADLRTFPTRLRVFKSRGDTDIDRFQESALFPGTPVVIAHESRDRAWWFVVSPLYAAWVEKESIAEGAARQVLDYARKTPYLVVTGAKALTTCTAEQPQVSELQLDMGVRVPLLTGLPPDQRVNGQSPRGSHVIELPLRASDGSLSFTAALLPDSSDTATEYLPLSPANLLRQSFKFLGERYGWGHSHDARDCSGFVSDVYRSFGVELPRNTGDQSVSPAIDRLTFTAEDSHEARLAALENLAVGDLIYIPGHVMMVIGHEQGMPYVIHDTVGISYRTENAGIVRVPLNAVSVTPLTPLLLGSGAPMIDRIYSILRIGRS